MKAMIFAAGLGTRLRPLTDNVPKALVEVAGKPMLQRTIEHVKFHGFTDIIVNVHHHADQVIQFLNNLKDDNIKITISDESDELLDTGGGLKKASWFFNDQHPFLVINADVISNLNLAALLKYHLDKQALATLVVRDRSSGRCFLFDHEHLLCGWRNNKNGESIIIHESKGLTGWPFSGIHMISPAIFDMITNNGKFSIVDTYLQLAADNKIYGFMDNNSLWFDIGDQQKLEKAASYLQSDSI